ncbi:unnamed protein product [Rangifer tarandus platyrhynchus]|uniref:Uncharacterized protein n=2 Tax=Rangifer tarandus platyrhynchus TaxID=3082113 RepID=A0ABN8ZIA0_RANTA|nr:unnamed protein product [Rangifer tarandus platyrhynchus]
MENENCSEPCMNLNFTTYSFLVVLPHLWVVFSNVYTVQLKPQGISAELSLCGPLLSPVLCVCMYEALSRVRLWDPWTGACRASLSMGVPRQESGVGCRFQYSALQILPWCPKCSGRGTPGLSLQLVRAMVGLSCLFSQESLPCTVVQCLKKPVVYVLYRCCIG